MRRATCLGALLLLLLDGGRAEANRWQEPTAGEPAPAPQPEGGMALEERLSIQVVTASQQAESLQEAPVPVTVITSDMIRSIGARNLQDVLTTYVPGMTYVIDHNERNVAMRGIYASSQQKILVMLDGHRLNSRAYSMAAPDYAISLDLDKVKQIEVLRGPGSSLYGNVALMAVVNIVTKKGADLNGATVRVGGGDFISRNDSHPFQTDGALLAAGRAASFVAGAALGRGHDLLLWGSIFSADGQRVAIKAADDFSAVPKDGKAIVDGYRDPNSEDLGLRYRVGDFSFYANYRLGHQIEPFAGGGATTGDVYDYDRFRAFQTIKPGLGHRSSHFEARWVRELSKAVTLDLTGYYDRGDVIGAIVSDPTLGRSAFLNWNDDAIGFLSQGYLKYELLGSGTLLGGFQLDSMRVLDSGIPTTNNFDWAGYGDTNSARVIDKGQEIIYSPFFQVKHKFSELLLANVGLRYDIKDRHKGKEVSQLSPRVAVVLTPSKTIDLKLSYSESFVDAPFWYRYNVFPAYQGSANLQPERLRSVQATAGLSLLDGRLTNSINVFYDDVFNFIYRNLAATGTDPKYNNAGKLRSIGVEDEAAFIQDRYGVRANVTFQQAVDSKDFGERDGEIFNVPRLVGNLILDANPLGSFSNKLWLNLTVRYTSSQLAPVSPTFRLKDGVVTPFSDPKNREDQYALVSFGLRASRILLDGLSFDLTFHNLLDQRYNQGGSTAFAYPQGGRSYMGYLTYKLPL